MLSSATAANSLLLRVVFQTAKSARQTTPNLIKNPKLTPRGIFSPPPKSYAYHLPQNLKNRHLYWNNTEQNRIRRREYNAHRLYKLGIKPIHDEKGVLLNNRSLDQVLYELSNLRLLKESLGRTLINLREIAQNFPEVMKGEDRGIVEWALQQVHDRNLASMTAYEFSTYCYLRSRMRVPATSSLLVHLYKMIEGEVEQPSGRIRPRFFLHNIKYIFATAPLNEQNQLLYKRQQEFKLFEDITPSNKPLIEVLPRLFTEEQLVFLTSEKDFDLEDYKFLLKIPGGKGLLDRIQQVGTR